MARRRFWKWRGQASAGTNIASILSGALFLGLAIGLPVGYFSHQLYAASLNSNSNLAELQK
jgi:hypothetical protein